MTEWEKEKERGRMKEEKEGGDERGEIGEGGEGRRERARVEGKEMGGEEE